MSSIIIAITSAIIKKRFAILSSCLPIPGCFEKPKVWFPLISSPPFLNGIVKIDIILSSGYWLATLSPGEMVIGEGLNILLRHNALSIKNNAIVII